MRKIILYCFALLAWVSCNVADQEIENSDTVKVSFGVDIPTNGSRNISAISSPTVNYTLKKGTDIYQTGNNVPLSNYSLKLLLIPENSYSFTQFDVYDGATLIYALDTTKTSEVFAVDTSGAISPNPATVYLMYQLGDGYDDVIPGIGVMEVKTDYQALRNLTFKVTVPTDVTVTVQHKLNNTSWSSDLIYRTDLANGAVYDMDTRALQDYSIEADDNVNTVGGTLNASDEFRFFLKKGSRESVIYFKSTDFNQKDIIFY